VNSKSKSKKLLLRHELSAKQGQKRELSVGAEAGVKRKSKTRSLVFGR
jgi:hypothetical protein